MKRAFALAAMALIAAGCGGSSSTMMPSAPSAVSAAPAPGSGGASGTSTATGTWTGTGTDSSSTALGAGGMMGQAGMGSTTWQLTHVGSNVTGTVMFAGMHGRTGTFTGTMTGDHMTFEMHLPGQGMMGANCAMQATGTAHMDPATMTLVCNYSGTNACSGPFMNGQMRMVRR